VAIVALCSMNKMRSVGANREGMHWNGRSRFKNSGLLPKGGGRGLEGAHDAGYGEETGWHRGGKAARIWALHDRPAMIDHQCVGEVWIAFCCFKCVLHLLFLYGTYGLRLRNMLGLRCQSVDVPLFLGLLGVTE
jgi:hypothetical protein